MSEPVVGDQNGPLIQLQVNGQQIEDKSPHSIVPNMIIQITEQRRKKQVISIDDSDEQAPRQSKPSRPKERKQPNDVRKVKKLSNRCLLCKQPGKKSSMKVCLDCRSFFHQACLEQQGESAIRYRCRKCRHKREEGIVLIKKAEKGQKGNQQKLAGKRLQKEKKRQQQQKKMGEFQLRYPYYFQEDKIRFPIEDKLLFIYRQLFEFAETPKPKPAPHHVIPTPLLADLLQIENFFSTFKEELIAYGSLPTEMNKIIFYLSMESYGIDSVFSSLAECLIKIYLSDIFDKNKTDNVRILNEHPFFTLLIHLNDNTELNQQVIVKAAQEILRYLATVPSMKRAFEDMVFPEELNLQTKITLILSLIRGLSQIDEFHELVSIKSERMQQLTKEKTELVAQLKVDEAQNLSNNQKLKDMAVMGFEMEQAQEGVTRQLTKELDKHKKKIQKLTSQQTKTEETIKQIRNKINQIGKAMPFLTSQIQFLGLDRNNSQYFFYIREPNRLYVKLRSYLMDNNQYFYVYEGKEVINEILRSLNTKGLHEKHLYENIVSLLKDQIINFNFEPAPASNFILEENKFRSIAIEDILNLVQETESTFSVYLSVRQFQWAAPSVRDMFMEQFMAITDLHILKQQIRSLQESFLFAEYSNPESNFKRDEDSEEEVKVELKQGRKKVPIRIWGINSEKTKKYWIQYLQECIDVVGVWICAFIFKSNVDKYVKKKMDAYYEQQIKDSKPKNRSTRERGRPPINRNWERFERVEKKSSSVNEPSYESEEVVEVEPEEEEEQADQDEERVRRPNLRKRSAKKMNIESDMDVDVDEMEQEDSSNEDCCEICGDYGQMICCDTCPKVYHKDCLKIKDVPEGEWSCFKCLQKLSNERQTRSKVKKLGKYL